MSTIATHQTYKIIVLLCFIYHHGYAQTDTPNLFDLSFDRFSFMEFDLGHDESTKSEVMFCDGWCEDQIVTAVDTLYTKFNLDLSTSFYYVHYEGKVIALRSAFIKSFNQGNRVFVNYENPKTQDVMILELLVDGKHKLFNHHELVYRKPDFNPVLGIGNKKGSYKRKYRNYAFCDDRLIELPSKAKKALKLLQKECGVSKSLRAKGELTDLFLKINK